MQSICNKIYFLIILFIIIASPSWSQDNTILRIENVRTGWNKLKLGNNPTSFWSPKVDVYSGGNTHLEVEFRIPEGNPDLAKLQIRPNGYGANPVTFGAYAPAGFSYGDTWYLLSIPLADFDPAINLSQLNLLQLPYSNNASPFVMEIRSVTFTGGSTPYLWYGEDKRNIIHDGQAGPGQMAAANEHEYYLEYHVDLSGKKYTNAYYSTYYTGRTAKCQEALITAVLDGSTELVQAPAEAVVSCQFVPGTYQVSSTHSDGRPLTGSFTIPPSEPLVAATTLTPPDGTNNGNLKVTLSGGTGSYFNFDGYNYEIITDSAENFTNGIVVGSAYGEDFSNIQTDLEGNIYLVYNDTLQKRTPEGALLWQTALNTGGIYGKELIYTDPVGNTYITGRSNPGFSIKDYYAGNDEVTAYLCRINSAGNPDWIRKIDIESVSSLKGDGKGHLYVSNLRADIYKFTIDGRLLWQQGTVSSYNSGSGFSDLTIDEESNIYLGTTMDIYATYGGVEVPDFDNAKENLSVMVIKLDKNGNVQWFKPLAYASDVRGLEWSSIGTIHIIKTHYIPVIMGTMSAIGYLEVIDTDGNEIYQHEVTTGIFSTVTSITADPAGYVYIGANPNVITKVDPLGFEINKIRMPTQYYYAATPFLTSNRQGDIVMAAIGDGYWEEFLPGMPYNSLFIARLEPASTYNINLYPTATMAYYEMEDARGNRVSEEINFTGSSITGINARLEAGAYEVKWKPPYSDVSGYEVYRKAGNEYKVVGRTGPSETTFADYTVQEGEKPEYKVKALVAHGERLSNPHSPVELTALTSAGGKVQLQWRPYTGYEKPVYTLYRGTSAYDMKKVAQVKPGTVTFTDQLPDEGTYMYRMDVREAKHKEMEASMSNLVQVQIGPSSERLSEVWPNPALGAVNCRYDGRSADNTLQLTDVNGRILKTYRNIDPNGHTVDRGDLSEGVYLLTFEDQEGTLTDRVIFR
ncbi:T9SS type A sorting domain-containing protein [Roseivirga sp. BDSF3-8]|uniref:T9SS type A sorting domain-containing protein n=1 Tax=Roseivirga sp. BDSF3-8 TaxID=3241598 RepID=UPI00353242A7